MKPATITTIVIISALIIAIAIWYFFNKAPKLDINAYNSLGQEGIVQRQGDFPYCKTCQNLASTEDMVSNKIDYRASDSLSDPIRTARNRVAMAQAY